MVVTTVAVVARTIGASGMFKVYGRRCTMIIIIVNFFVLIRKKFRLFCLLFGTAFPIYPKHAWYSNVLATTATAVKTNNRHHHHVHHLQGPDDVQGAPRGKVWHPGGRSKDVQDKEEKEVQEMEVQEMEVQEKEVQEMEVQEKEGQEREEQEREVAIRKGKKTAKEKRLQPSQISTLLDMDEDEEEDANNKRPIGIPMANEETTHQISNGIHGTNPLDFQWHPQY